MHEKADYAVSAKQKCLDKRYNEKNSQTGKCSEEQCGYDYGSVSKVEFEVGSDGEYGKLEKSDYH